MKQQIVRALAILSWIQFAASNAFGAPEGQSSPGPAQSAPIDFFPHVQRIFADRCYSCHGPEKQKSGLRLDVKERAFAGGDTGKAFLPGKSGESLLYRYVAGLDPEIRMPPKGEPLTTNQIALVRAWIDAGAPWPDGAAKQRVQHWSFKKPERSKTPVVKNARWVRTPIDAFVLSKLESLHIAPAPEADKATLIRRLSLDLIGLPPSPEAVSAFMADQNVDAYDHLVDSLLSSPHFGERWGRHWLDLARYADSEGYQVDRARPWAYVYRNWVIDACNSDMPFDQFTVEQLAGDLLPNATREQRIATGFHRNTLMNYEDGVDAEEFRCKAKSDRVATTGITWLGLTVGCAECHSHKFDPISQREFYQLYAFFNNAEEADISAPQADQSGALAQTFRQSTNCVKTYLHIRGDFLRHGEEVQPGALAALNEFRPRAAVADRLDLARWIVNPANPLTSRVAVNRIWQHLFGRGLVSTPEDFGTRGELPSHPELLDWLATEFMRLGWSRKELIKLIVHSACYRQSSHVRPELAQIDPNNNLLARQNRFRVEAEIIRDLQFACGGLLNDQIKGPSYRPAVTDDFKALGSAGAFTWEETQGPERYKRGLYVFTQRTVPYPMSKTFDAANPNECCPRRENSNTPLQALTLLNNPAFIESAQGLARRMFFAQGASVADRLAYGFQICLGRKPSPEEGARLQTLFDQERNLVARNPNCATALQAFVPALACSAPDMPNCGRTAPAEAGTPNHKSGCVSPSPLPGERDGVRGDARTQDAAAFVLVAQVLMNLDEFITRE